MHQFETSFGQFSLAKYPTNKKDPLLPFDNADKYVLAWIKDNLSPSPILIINDDHGALSIPLVKQGFTVLCYSDSATALANIKNNLNLNNINPSNIKLTANVDELVNLSKSEEFINLNHCIGRIPKSHSQLLLLLTAMKSMEIDKLVLGIMAKHLSKSTVEVIETYYQETKPSLAWKKSRIVIASSLKETQDATYKKAGTSLVKTSSSYSYKNIKINNLPGVFAQSNIDIGARLMLDTIEELIQTRLSPATNKTSLNVADLGCGNGILGTFWKNQRPMDRVNYFDDSYLALTSSALNAALNASSNEQSPNAVEHSKSYQSSFFNHTDCLGYDLDNQTELNLKPDDSGKLLGTGDSTVTENLEFVLCNPPFHSQFKLNDQIALRMFKQAKKALNRNGTLIVVGNRHLNYHTALKSIFKNCKTINSNAKFVVLEAVK